MGLFAWRSKHGFSQAQAGLVLGFDQSAITRIERGIQWLSFEAMHKIIKRSMGEITADGLYFETLSHRRTVRIAA